MFGTSKKQNAASRHEQIGGMVAGQNANLALDSDTRAVLGKIMLSTQSFDGEKDGQAAQVAEAIATKTNVVANGLPAAVQEAGLAALTSAEIENIRMSMAIAQDPVAYMAAAKQGRDKSALLPALGGEADVGRYEPELSTQSYEAHQMVNTLQHTVSYNVSTEKQSAAVELFFPTIELGLDQNNFTIDTHLLTVFASHPLDVTGKSPRERNQKNILKGLRDASILRSEFTDLVPIFRAGQNEDAYLAAAVHPSYSYTNSNGEAIVTAPLKMGVEHNVIGLSQTDRQLGLGTADFTDQISANPRLKTLVLNVGGKGIRYENLEMLGASTFTYQPTGDSQGIQLNFEGNTFVLHGALKAADGSAITELDALKSKGLEALLRFEVVGKGNTDYGTVAMSAMAVVVERIRPVAVPGQPRGLDLPLDGAEAQAVIAALGALTLDGFEIEGTKTNANIREHGLILDDRIRRVVYGVRLHSPISVIKPKDEQIEVSDAQRVDRLVQTSFIRRTNAGVDTLYNILALLKSIPEDVVTNEIFAVEAMGVIGQWFVKPWCRDIAVDVLATIQSMQNTDRLANAFSVLNNLMLTEAAQAYTRSELASVSEITAAGTGGYKPHVIAMADPFTRAFIFRENDTRMLGDAFDFTIESCSDNRLVNTNQDGEYGTIFMSFGVPKTGSTNAHLHFGNTLSKQDIPRILNRSRQSAYSHEVMVQPWFTHIWHLPVLIHIVVKNLKAAVDQRVPFVVEVQP